MQKENKFTAFFTYLFAISVLALPLFFWPYIFNPIANSKSMLIFALALLTMLGFVINSLKQKSWQILKTPVFIPALIFAGLVIVSSLVSHQYPAKQLLGLGGGFLSVVLLIVLLPSLLNKNVGKLFLLFSNIAAAILSTLAILQLFNVSIIPLINHISMFELPNSLAFALTGGTFISIQFLSVVLLSNVIDQKNWRSSWLIKLNTVLIAIALGISIWAVLPGQEASFQALSLNYSSLIARDSMALTRNALFGYGPDAYGNAYNVLKPIAVNGSKLWQFTFESAFNVPLTIVVSLGLIASLAYFWLIAKSVGALKQEAGASNYLKVFIILSLIWQLFAPVNLLMLVLFGLALAAYFACNQDHYSKLSFTVPGEAGFLPRNKWQKNKKYLFTAGNFLISLSIAVLFYQVGKTFAAYHLLYQSGASLERNDVVTAYQKHQQAKILAPHLDFIRQSYSLLNLQIAIALSNKADISPAEQEQVLQLVNQAITEAKAATILNPGNYQNWLALAKIYMQLLESTEQAQQEAFNALASAANYNPSSPEIRIALGQLFFSLKKYPEAVTFFNQSVERKPDLFLGHYYLAQALIANEQPSEAYGALLNSLSLLDTSSEEYEIVQKEAEALKTQLEELAKQTKQNTQGSNPSESTVGALNESNFSKNTSDSSSLSELLDQKDAENVIQESALTPNQNLVEN